MKKLSILLATTFAVIGCGSEALDTETLDAMLDDDSTYSGALLEPSEVAPSKIYFGEDGAKPVREADAVDPTADTKPTTGALAEKEDRSDFSEYRDLSEKGFYLTTAVWDRFDIPVCWETSGNSTEKGWVKTIVTNGWEAKSGIVFSGWGTCTDSSKGIRIQVTDAGPKTRGLGKALDGMKNGLVLNFTFKDWSPSCTDSSTKRRNCIDSNALHEFGHALGIAHEHNRIDSWLSCTDDPQGTNGDTTVGSFDPDSIMNYCYDSSYSAKLSAGDIKTIQRMYPLSRKTDVGVIPDADTSCPGETVTIFMDDEDSNNENSHSGWNGEWGSDNNTRTTFCRVAGDKLKHLASTSARTTDYAVLRLGATCPNESKPFQRYFDNEDDRNTNQKVGDIRPSVQGGNTRMEFCVFSGNSTASLRMTALPDLGFKYGVLAAPTFSKGSKYGSVHTDDEDSDNENSSSGSSVGKYMIEVGANTTMHLWKR